jgi:hypothetical protein
MKTEKHWVKIPLTKKDLKWHTLEEVFGKVSKNKEFKKGYREEALRIRLSQRIRDIRIEKKLTQEAVAERASMP